MFDRKTILLIEDDEEMRAELSGALSRAGLTVASAGDGDKGLAFLRENHCDLLLLDLKLPGLNGREILKIIKSERPRLKVFIVTGSLFNEAGERALAQADAIINKPFRVAGLIERIKEALG